MNLLNLIILSHIFFKSNIILTYEIIFNSILKSALFLNINSVFFNLTNNLFSWDKTSYLFILLTLVLMPFSLLSNWNSIVIFNSKKLFYSILIWVEVMLIITFSTTDLFIFYLGFEGLSIPVFFLIFLYGAELTKIRASIYFLIYSLSSSTFMGIAIFLLYSQFGTTDVLLLQLKLSNSLMFIINNSDILNNSYYINLAENYVSMLTFERLGLVWIFLFLSFAIKMPLVPFHMWLPEAHAEAPTSGSIILTGLILKLGGYGIYKFFIPIFGKFNYFLPFVYAVCIIGIVYIGLTCLKINHIKQIIAYSSIVHMNATCLGLFTNKVISSVGAIYSMLSHSLISSSLFLLAGILYNRYDSYFIENYSGIVYNMPYFSFFLSFMLIANIATPLTSGFISELLILIDLSKINIIVLFLFSVNYLVNTGYSIWLLNRIIFTDVIFNKSSLKYKFVYYNDLTLIEIGLLSLMLFLIILIGIIPNILLEGLIF